VLSDVVDRAHAEGAVGTADRAPILLRHSEPIDRSAISAILIAEACVIREALIAALERDGRVRITEATSCPDVAVAAIRHAKPDVTLVQLPIVRGIIAAQAIRAVDYDARLLVFGVSNDAREILAWAEAGVLGCLDHDATLVEFLDAIAKVARGGSCCSSSVAAALFRHVAGVAKQRVSLLGMEAARSPLTSREAEILLLVARGLANKEVAAALSLSVPTVKNHLHRIYQKLGIRRRAETAAWASATPDEFELIEGERG
jgi:two-component system, NarL family, nitrate/nitrite response regulator NarL